MASFYKDKKTHLVIGDPSSSKVLNYEWDGKLLNKKEEVQDFDLDQKCGVLDVLPSSEWR